MRLLLSLLLIGISAGALAAPPATGKIVVLKCRLAHSVPRVGGHTPPPPFTQHFHVDMTAGTVDGVKATVSPDAISWEPKQSYLRPSATLSLPSWHFHAEKWFGKVRDNVTGACVEEG
jgi:hypothetical protein